MKSLVLALFFVVSCGKYELPNGSSIGNVRTFNAVKASSGDKLQFSKICGALPHAGTQYDGTNLTYQAVQDGCGQAVSDVNTAPVMKVQIQGTILKQVDSGTDFLFPVLDTPSSGVMTTVCGSLDKLTNPNMLPNGDAQWVTSAGISESNCEARSGETCVLIETGSPQGDQQFVIHTQEWVRFRTDPNLEKVGFVTYRKKVSRSVCKNTEFVTTQALLK